MELSLLGLFPLAWRRGDLSRSHLGLCGMLGFHLRRVFFVWEATWGKDLTLDQLQWRGWSLANRCFRCHTHEESIDHILLHYSKARALRQLLFCLSGISWVIDSSFRDTLLGWQGSFVGRKRKKVWGTAPLCLFWIIWKERNRRTFENEELSKHRQKVIFLCSLYQVVYRQ